MSPSATSHSAAAWKSSNTFCLSARRPASMPRVAVLVPATEPGDGVQPTSFAPRRDGLAPHRCLGDREAAVAVEDRRGRRRRNQIGPMDEEQPDLGAVGRGIGPVADGQLRDTACPVRLRRPSTQPGRLVPPPDGHGLGEAGDAHETARPLPIGGEADRCDRGNVDGPDQSAVGERASLDTVDCSVGDDQHDLVAGDRERAEHFVTFGHQRAPVLDAGFIEAPR